MDDKRKDHPDPKRAPPPPQNSALTTTDYVKNTKGTN